MSERVWTSMTIGGSIPANRIKHLADAIDCDFTNKDWDIDTEKVIEDTIKDGESLTLNGDTNCGNPNEVEAFCESLGLPYWKWFDAGGEWGAGIQIFDPQAAPELPTECAATSQTYLPTIDMHELIEAGTRGDNIADIIERLQRFTPERIKPLTLGADAPAEVAAEG